LAADREVRTVEALAADGDLSLLQRALEQHDVVQCGMCFPGMLIALTSYFEQAKSPNRDDMKAALVGNVCRCTGYERILDAALSLGDRAETR
jgi:carbon-monoxide dehydrogenase small subunit